MTFGIFDGMPVALVETVDGWMMIAVGTLCVVSVLVEVGTIEFGAELGWLGGGDAMVTAIVLEDGVTVDEGSTPVPELLMADEDTTEALLETTTVPELTIGEEDTTTELETAVPLEIGALDTGVEEGVVIGVELTPVSETETGVDDTRPVPEGRLTIVEEIGMSVDV